MCAHDFALPCTASASVSVYHSATLDLRSQQLTYTCYFLQMVYHRFLRISQMPSKHATSLVLCLSLRCCQMSDCFVERTSEVRIGGKGQKVLLPLWPACSALIYYLKCHGEWMSRKGSAEEMHMALSPSPFIVLFSKPFSYVFNN